MSLALVIVLNAVFASVAIGAILALAITALKRERRDQLAASGARTLTAAPPRSAQARPRPARQPVRAFAARQSAAGSS